MPDLVVFQATGAATGEGLKYQYVITNEELEITDFPAGNMADFEDAGPGLSYIWGFCYSGELTAQLGDHVYTTQFATEGWAISTNALKVFRVVPDGGTVSLRGGGSEKTICSQDGYDDPVAFEHESASMAQYRYLITDEANIILAIPEGDHADFEGAAPGVCRIWGLSFSGSFTAAVGQNAAESALSDGCFDLSDNYLSIIRTDVDGGTVITTEGTTVVSTVPGDGLPDVVNFQHESSAAANYIYVITDEDNRILTSLTANSHDFEGAGLGVCRIWGLSYTGNLELWPGDVLFTKAFSDDCFDLSGNYISVYRGVEPELVEGGTVALPDGEGFINLCSGDGTPDVVHFLSNGAVGPAFVYLVTDPDLNILAVVEADSLDFDGAEAGICLVWGLAYSGQLTAAVGTNAGASALSDGLYDLSDDFITVLRDRPDGGLVTTDTGATEVDLTVGDGMSDLVTFSGNGPAEYGYSFIVTDTNDRVLVVLTGNSIDFEAAAAGASRIWGISYTGNLLVKFGDNLQTAVLSDGCYDLSDSFVLVRRLQAAGGFRIPAFNSVNIDPDLRVFPNPARDVLNLHFDLPAVDRAELQLYVVDALGRLVFCRQFVADSGRNEYVVPITALENGGYTLLLQAEGHTQSAKFIKVGY